jgi:hypothetical protein
MCRVEERVYIKADGQRQTFEDPFPCHKSKHGKLCSNVKRKTTEYYPKLKPIIRDSRDGTISPASYDPPTPDGTGSYLVQQHRPSLIERRLSTREGSRVVKPEIIIEIGPKKNKNRSKKYPAISVETYNRSSLGAAPNNSNEFAIESPGSDESFTVRTGLAETPVPLTIPYQQPPSGYSTRPAMPHNHHRHTSSASSFTTSSQPPSLYATSEPESPTDQRTPRFPPTIVHNPPQFTAPPTQTRATPATPSTATFHINFAGPQDATPRPNIGSDNLFPLNYAEFHDRSAPSSHASSGHTSSSHASSGRAVAPEIINRPGRTAAPEIIDRSGRAAAPEIIDRANERDRLRRLHKENEKRRQEEDSRLLAQQIAQEQAQTRAKEEEKQVRFEMDRYKDRESQRAEARLAESERRRAEERQESRARKQKEQDERDALAAKERQEARARKQKEQDEQDALAAKEEKRAKDEKRAKADRLAAEIIRKEKAIKDTEAQLMGREPRPRDSRPPTRDMPNTTRQRTRRPSISRAQAQERDLLLAETEAQMAREREATEQREREENNALLRQQQQTSQYYDPRGGARNPITVENSGLGGRRGSVSGRRPSISAGPPPPTSLGRTGSQRRSSVIHQASPATLPPINTQYSTRPPSAHRNQSASLFSPAGSGQTFLASRPPSARHSSYGQENPFAAPPTRTSQENPFAPAPGVAQPMPSHDPWDTRNMREALPQAIQTQIRQPSTALGLEQSHTLKRRGEDVINRATEDRSSRARQATRSMRKATGFEDDYESEGENAADKSASFGPRVRKEKRKH